MISHPALAGALLRSLVAVLWVLALAGPVPAQETSEDDRVEARAMLNRGVEAYKHAKFDDAVTDFERAKELDPSLVNAQLYLAVAYASQYVPGATSPENLHYGELATQEFRAILDKDPTNISAIDGIGSILYNMGGTPFDVEKLEKAKEYQELHIRLRPDDPEPYYWVGVIDWSIAYRSNQDIRNEYNRNARQAIKPADPLTPDLAARFNVGFGRGIDEGISNLKKTIDLKPNYTDAMAYLNLLYRQKADTEISASARANDLRMADDLVDQVMKIKRREAAAPQFR